jgi:uncharacterized protein (DUF305 family)
MSMTKGRHCFICLLVAVAGFAACTTSPSPQTGSTPSPAAGTVQGAPAKQASPADVAFMTGMIHHHAQALVMAKLADTHAANPSIKVLSERITVSQTDEIRMMQQWLRENGAEAPEPSPTGQRMQMGGVTHDMLMPGMLTEEQMTQLERARGPEFDRLFLTFMIQHHEGALTMVDQLFASHGGGVDDFIYKIASDTFADQGSEIDRMQRMLDAMASSGR